MCNHSPEARSRISSRSRHARLHSRSTGRLIARDTTRGSLFPPSSLFLFPSLFPPSPIRHTFIFFSFLMSLCEVNETFLARETSRRYTMPREIQISRKRQSRPVFRVRNLRFERRRFVFRLAHQPFRAVFSASRQSSLPRI